VGQSPGALGSSNLVTLPIDPSANHFFRLHSP
jgi:hypothetical protein